MSVVVVNRLRFSVPVDEVAADVRGHFPPAFEACEGFERFYFVKTAEDEGFAVIVWDSAEHAQAGADAIGSTVFNTYLTPRLVDQDRRVGPTVAFHQMP